MDDTDDASATAEAAAGIRRVIRRELDDCERAINAGEYDKAKGELGDAVRKLKRIANNLGYPNERANGEMTWRFQIINH
jgi:hypothetical protein